jgi:hypothetical protein
MESIKPVIVCIAKQEHNYIEEFIKYHLALGFDHIYLYDNEDVPTYYQLLEKYSSFITFIHMPGKSLNVLDVATNVESKIMIQYGILVHFTKNYIDSENITHVLHIDIDEFVVLKHHENIKTFIQQELEEKGEYGGAMFMWRWFGDSNLSEDTYNIPNTIRFTKCSEIIECTGKTLFNKNHGTFLNIHEARYKEGMKCKIVPIEMGQLNHYKGKTWEEYKIIRQRGRIDIQIYDENMEEDFKNINRNEVEDLYAYHFYRNILT